jgi:hypothetical protein
MSSNVPIVCDVLIYSPYRLMFIGACHCIV